MEEPPAKLASAVIAKILDDVYEGAKSGASSKSAALSNEVRLGFSKLLRESYERRSKIRTLLDRVEPVDLRDYYVCPIIKLGGREISDDQLVDEIVKRRRVVLSGTAGAGKSVLMKHLFLSFVEGTAGSLPIFLELRNLNDFAASKDNLLQLILESIKVYLPRFSEDRLTNLLQNGRVSLFLDGLDEVNPAKRNGVITQLRAMGDRFPRCEVIVSSRPDDEVFAGWEEFSVLHVRGMDRKRCEQLIKKLKCDEELKGDFLKKVVEKDFTRYAEFLSVPLLATMMFLVHAQGGEVPKRMTAFYRKAYEALQSGHDLSKGGFRRETYSKLEDEQFTRALQAFCAASYIDGNYSFEKDALQKTAEAALRSELLNVDAGLFVKDLLQSICLLHLDGTEYSFVHRSFQEFFAAEFLSSLDIEEKKRHALIVSVFARASHDKVVALMRDIDEVAFEKNWLLPLIAFIEANWGGMKRLSRAIIPTVVMQLYLTFSITDDGRRVTISSLNPSALGYIVMFALHYEGGDISKRNIVNELFRWFDPLVDDSKRLREALQTVRGKKDSRKEGIKTVATMRYEFWQQNRGGDKSWMGDSALNEIVQSAQKTLKALKAKTQENVKQRTTAKKGLFDIIQGGG